LETQVSVPEGQLAALARRHRIRRLALFGSILREDFGPDSDVDVLVEFEPGHVPGFIGMAEIELELSRLFGRKVDLRTAAELSRYFRDDVLREARTICNLAPAC
jgi:predicted nucleotidyltransferase